MRNKRATFNKRIIRPLKKPESLSVLIKKIILPLQRLASLEIPEDLSVLVKSGNGTEILSLLDLKESHYADMREILSETYKPLVAVLDLTWTATDGEITRGAVELCYTEAIRSLKNLIEPAAGPVKYGMSGLKIKGEIERDIHYLEKRLVKIKRFKQSEVINITFRQMIAKQCYLLVDYLEKLTRSLTAKTIYTLVSELLSNLYSAKFTPTDIKYLYDYHFQKKFDQ